MGGSAVSKNFSNEENLNVGRVYIVTPGGLTAKGGIGRMVDYIYRSWNTQSATLLIVDSYGPGSKLQMPFYFLACYVRILFNALFRRVDLLHIHMSERLSVFRKGCLVHLGCFFNIPVVLHLHGADFADYCDKLSPSQLQRVCAMMSKADAVVVLGEYWSDFVQKKLKIPKEKVAVLHNAVPGPDSVPVKQPSQTCKILFLGVVCERKGVPVLLSALSHQSLKFLNWQVSFAGNGDVETFKSLAEQLLLKEKVTFTGWVDETRAKALLKESDVLVLPSRNEGLPMAILEAMAYGLPIVSTPVGSIKDAVITGENGLLVPVGDSNELANALKVLISDSALRTKMGLTSRSRYLKMYEISSFNKKLLTIYRRAKLKQPIEIS